MVIKIKKRVVPTFLAIMMILSSFHFAVSAAELSLDELKIQAKQAVAAEFETYDEEDYYTAEQNEVHNWQALVAIKNEAIGESVDDTTTGTIGEAQDEEYVTAAKVNAIEGMKEILTKEEADAADLQAERDKAVEEIETAFADYNLDLYTQAGRQALQAICNGAAGRLNECTDAEEIKAEQEAIIAEFGTILTADTKTQLMGQCYTLLNSLAAYYAEQYPEVKNEIAAQQPSSSQMITNDSVTVEAVNAELQEALDLLLAPVKTFVAEQLEAGFSALEENEIGYRAASWAEFETAYEKAVADVAAVPADGDGNEDHADIAKLKEIEGAFETAKSALEAGARNQDQINAVKKVMGARDTLIDGGYATGEELAPALEIEDGRGLRGLKAIDETTNTDTDTGVNTTPNYIANRTVIDMYIIAATAQLEDAYETIPMDEYGSGVQEEIEKLYGQKKEEIASTALGANASDTVFEGRKTLLDPAAAEGTIVKSFLDEIAAIEKGEVFTQQALDALDQAFALYETDNAAYWYTAANWVSTPVIK
mgnify:CR=1 FL=1